MNEFGFVEDTVDDLGFVEEPVTASAMVGEAQESDVPLPDTGQLGYRPPPAPIGVGESILRGGSQGLTLSLGDEASGALAGGAEMLSDFANDRQGRTFGEAYEGYRDSIRSQNAAAQEANPVAYGAAEWAGSAAVPGAGMAGNMALKAGGTALKNVAKVRGVVAKPAADILEEVTKFGAKKLPAVTKVISGAIPKTLGEVTGASIGASVGGVPGAVAGSLAVKGGKKVAKAVSENVKKLIKPYPMTLYSSGKGKIGRVVDTAFGEGKEIVGGAVLNVAGRIEGAKMEAFANKYGDWIDQISERGDQAVTSNVFIKQQTDPAFNAMYKAAREEAAKESEEN